MRPLKGLIWSVKFCIHKRILFPCKFYKIEIPWNKKIEIDRFAISVNVEQVLRIDFLLFKNRTRDRPSEQAARVTGMARARVSRGD